MGLFDWLRGLFDPGRFDLEELARRLDVSSDELLNLEPKYRHFTVPKRGGGIRFIHEPHPELKRMQRRILRRLLRRLACHPAATGFRPGLSIVHNAIPHVGKAVVVRMDIRNFFLNTRAERVARYFRFLGWKRQAVNVLCRLCTDMGGLPQGAPTSPMLSNLVNYPLDARLAALARRLGADYTRYVDDLTFSFAEDDPSAVRYLVRRTKGILAEYGYWIHHRKKLRICRQHQQQLVTGLVVNRQVNLPRKTRRWLRAVKHRMATGRDATLTPQQLDGWYALELMVYNQTRES